MKNKIIQVGSVLLLSLFSFYYTDKTIEFIRDKDPIMKSIKENEEKFTKEAVNATVTDNYVVPGEVGVNINYDESFQKMKQYGKYNESLFVFEEVEPTISLDDYYDKYISTGRGVNNDIALVFRVDRTSDISEILNVLDSNNTLGTFFVDGLWLENNQDLVLSMAKNNHEIEILNYNSSYEEVYFTSSLSLLESITNLKGKYCYAEYDNKEVLELCSRLKLHTVIPTIQTGNYPYKEIKNSLERGNIIGFHVNSSTEIELETVINYIKQKGYNITTLDYLLEEVKSIEK